MPKYLVRVDVLYSTTIEAESEAEAIDKAPDLPENNTDWDTCKPDFEAEECV